MTRYWFSFLAAVCVTATAAAQKDPPKLPAVLEKSCAHCHANGKSKGKFGSALDLARMIKDQRVVPGSPNESSLFARLGIDKDMPPEDAPPEVYRPKKEDIDEVRAWIEKMSADGEKTNPPAAPAADARTPVSEGQVLLAVKKDLDDTDERDRKFQRYFTLHHLHNNPRFKDSDLRLFRAAVSKLVNSLSLKNKIVVPRIVAGTQEAVLGIDLRLLDWDTCHFWESIASHYPYGLSHDDAADSKLATAAKDVYRMAGGRLPFKLPVLRADWFVVNAARPPLYHSQLFGTLLGLKGGSVSLQGKLLSGTRAMTDKDLEGYLGVKVEENILKQKVLRAAFGESGVSSQNRLVERHDAKFGAYWKSYDFLKNTGRGDLLQYPLGPVFENNPYNKTLAFEHDGGEIIFSLPNGLQAYLLVNGKGERIDAGPPDVVHDDNKISGRVEIVNGLSCMHCHAKGNKSLQQPSLTWLRDGHAVKGDDRRVLERLYPDEKSLKETFKDDQDRFTTALLKATKPFLKDGDQFLEPVGFVAVKMNVDDLSLEAAACELGLAKPDDLKVLIGGNEALQNLGLRPLANGRTIKRKVWEGPAPNSTNSVYQEAASALDRGTPYSVTR